MSEFNGEEIQKEASRIEKVSLDEIFNECADSPGYILFAGVIRKEKDSEGNNLISWKYRRYHVNFEDAKMSVQAFKDFIVNDMESKL